MKRGPVQRRGLPAAGRRNAWERLEERLARANERSNAELIRRMRQACFADVDALAASGTVKIPRE